ncbi:CLN3 protein [Trichomonas vaginalis G3]|uniref:CLN3 protein n=1 Tax=Trichomonas vaginalis (strain ATCC PRA-98 / G3) TaxID=412133 RepID=A2E4D8_TRIV3|nr:arginine transport [Trichomonas vaginalis G3]EAY12473.1 CLN3 protein [Trichomonas vaginalis G3]KAI5539536.1 arginine transport [Trichomonas vaginalis G3]|eukprot:XP_001324696.1 CLN3 protein [Trichomonas vaginalis G3]
MVDEPVITPSAARAKRAYIIRYAGMIIIGILSNLPYWVAYSNSQVVTTHFDKEGHIGAVSWAIVFLSVYATLFNAFLTSKNVSYTFRTILNGSFMIIGLIGAAFAPNFWVAICFIAFAGVSSDFGEAVMLGYAASFNDQSLLNAWGIGCGFSGLIGGIYSLICQKFTISYFWTFISVSPIGVIFPVIFVTMLKMPKEQSLLNSKEIASIESMPSYEHIEEDVPFCSCSNWKKSFRFIINNIVMFSFQYVALEGLTDCSMTKQEKINEPYIFGYYSLSYEFGQFIAKFLTKWLTLDKLEIAIVLGAIDFAIMLAEAITHFFPHIYLCIPLFFIGVLGSISYMSIFDVIMRVPNTTYKEREIITNYTSVFIGGSIQIASLIILVMQNTFLKKQCIK